MNHVDLVGRLTKDPEVRTGEGGKNIARFTVAVSREYKNKDGNYDADFISVITFGKTAEFVEKYFSKKSWIGLKGSIRTGKYVNKEGRTIYTTDVVAESVEFVGDKGGSDKNSTQPDQNPPGKKNSLDGFQNIPESLEDDLPFN